MNKINLIEKFKRITKWKAIGLYLIFIGILDLINFEFIELITGTVAIILGFFLLKEKEIAKTILGIYLVCGTLVILFVVFGSEFGELPDLLPALINILLLYFLYLRDYKKINMYKKPMNRIFKKLKGLGGSVLGGLLSLIFANGAKAQSIPVSLPLYGPPTPGERLSELLPFIGGVFLVFVIAPVVGLIWYRKRGGTKKWPSVIVWILSTLFVIALIALIIFLYSSLS